MQKPVAEDGLMSAEAFPVHGEKTLGTQKPEAFFRQKRMIVAWHKQKDSTVADSPKVSQP